MKNFSPSNGRFFFRPHHFRGLCNGPIIHVFYIPGPQGSGAQVFSLTPPRCRAALQTRAQNIHVWLNAAIVLIPPSKAV